MGLERLGSASASERADMMSRGRDRTTGGRIGVQVRSFGVAVTVTMLAFARANAQRTPIISLDAAVGVSGSVTNGNVYESAAAGPAADLTFAIRVSPARSGFVAAVNMTAYSVPVGGDGRRVRELGRPNARYPGACGWSHPDHPVRFTDRLVTRNGGSEPRPRYLRPPGPRLRPPPSNRLT